MNAALGIPGHQAGEEVKVPSDGPISDASPSSLKARYDAGDSVRRISRDTGIPVKTVHRRLRKAGTVFRRPGGRGAAPDRARPLTPAEEEDVKDAYLRGGVSLDDLGARYGRSGDSIGRLLRRLGVEVRPRGRTLAAGPAPEVRPAVAEMHRQGMRPADIAARIPGGDAVEIARELRQAGMAPHRGRPIPEGQALAVAYAKAGSVRALSASLRADEDRIKAALDAAGVPAGSLRRIPVQLRPEAARLAAAGTDPARIAQLTGLPAGLTAGLGPAPRAARAA